MLFPEAEVTRSLSNNLLKQVFLTTPKFDDKIVIDSNELLRKRREDLARKAEKAGFVSGLAAEVLEVPEDAGEGNVIKAGESDEAIREQARNEAEEILNEARREAERIREEARAQIEAEREQAMRQAKQEGYNAGHARALAEGEELKKDLLAKQQHFEEEYYRLIDTLEPRFVETITGIYEHIFHVELSSYRDILTYLIASTLRMQEGGHEFLIHVSKEDYPYVSMQKKQILEGTVSANCHADVVEDLTLGRNECMIETENGIFDCGLGTQLEELKLRLRLLAWSNEASQSS